MIVVETRTRTEVRVMGVGGTTRLFAVEIDGERGPVSSAGSLLALAEGGGALAIDALALLSAVWEAGRAAGEKK